MIHLLIIADDFTGALDTGVQFAIRGAATRVVTGPAVELAAAPEEVEVLSVDAETRHLPPKEAYRAVRRIAEQARALGVPYIYKKTDSALRGNIGAELTALLDGSGLPQLPFLPAFPQIGRTTAGGVHLVDGVPVAESVFGEDPFEPVCHSAVAQVIGEQSGVAVHSFPPLEQGETPAETGILVFDAQRSQDLYETGRRLLETGRLGIMAGCAGFGAMLPELLDLGAGSPRALPPLEPGLLVVCGSVNPISAAQMRLAEQRGFTRIELTAAQKLTPGYWESAAGEAALSAIRARLDRSPCCIIDVNDTQGNRPTEDYASRLGIRREDIRVGVARSLGHIVGSLFTAGDVGTMLITGGDTLLHCMNDMGVSEMEPVCEVATGVVLSRFTYRGHTRHVLSKSGGFGRPELIAELAGALFRTNCIHTI